MLTRVVLASRVVLIFSCSMPSRTAVVCMLAVACALPAGAPPPPPKSGISLWSAAKRFFSFREHLKDKVNASKTGRSPTSPFGAYPAAAFITTRLAQMPTTYAVSYKRMVAWYCAKPENKGRTLCSPTPSGGPASSTKMGPTGVPTNVESKELQKAYCAEKAHKQTGVCFMSSLHQSLQKLAPGTGCLLYTSPSPRD